MFALKSRSPGGSPRDLALVLALGPVLGGCIVGDERCSAHQVYRANVQSLRYCACAPDAIPSTDGAGCTPCGENELAAGIECVCLDGFARPTPGAPCRELAAGEVTLGQACGSDADCGGSFPHCEAAAQGGYCTTTGCTSHADCTDPFYCDKTGATSFCHTPPAGLGLSCQSNADCTGPDATFCDVVQTHSCIVSDCAPDPKKCGGWACCDFTALAGTTLCVPPSALTGGKCFDGSRPVQP
jgi:hypothetical protein